MRNNTFDGIKIDRHMTDNMTTKTGNCRLCHICRNKKRVVPFDTTWFFRRPIPKSHFNGKLMNIEYTSSWLNFYFYTFFVRRRRFEN